MGTLIFSFVPTLGKPCSGSQGSLIQLEEETLSTWKYLQLGQALCCVFHWWERAGGVKSTVPGAQRALLVLRSLPVKPLWGGQTPSAVRYLLWTLAFLNWSSRGSAVVTPQCSHR